MPYPEEYPSPCISALLTQVFPQSKAEVVLLRLISPTDYLRRLELLPPAGRALDSRELATFRNFKLAKRRAQWLTGRICAKQALIHYCRRYLPYLTPPGENQLHIGNTSAGRPKLFGEGLPPELHGLDISISHSGDCAMALASSTWGGIDIQQRSDSLLRVRDRFCRQEEEIILQRHLPSLDSLGQLNLLWAAKEAIKKARSHQKMPGFLQLHLQDIKKVADSGYIFHVRQESHLSAPLQVGAALQGVYALAICLPAEGIHA